METTPITAYIVSACVMIVLFLISTIIANMIAHRPGGGDITKRRIWFWVLGVLTPVIAFAINFYISTDIEVPTTKTTYLTQSGIASAVSLVIYILIGFILSKLFNRTKLGTWF